MPNIKLISDLLNYSEVLHDVASRHSCVFDREWPGPVYAIIDMQDYEKTQTPLRLIKKLAKGHKAGEEKGWLTLKAVEEHLGIANE